MRGRNNIGATLTEVIENFYEKIKKAGGRFYITELGENSFAAFQAQATPEVLEGIELLKKEEIIGKSTIQAVQEAQDWLKGGEIANTKVLS
jgi:sulfate permease, SulP family